MRAVFDNEISSSAVCYKSCVGIGFNFCPTTANFNKGNCCSDNNGCKGKVDMCAMEASSSKSMML
jgi:hypothetical protein